MSKQYVVRYEPGMIYVDGSPVRAEELARSIAKELAKGGPVAIPKSWDIVYIDLDEDPCLSETVPYLQQCEHCQVLDDCKLVDTEDMIYLCDKCGEDE